MVVPPENMWVVDGQTNCLVWIGKQLALAALLVFPTSTL